jgi:hypothetical protein
MDNFLIYGAYCDVEYSEFRDLRDKAQRIRDYFDSKYLNIIEILKPSYEYYKSVNIKFAKVINPSYDSGRIEVNPNTQLSEDNLGCLIHEGTHAIQNYPKGIDRYHPCLWLMEGIGDYCRIQICKDIKPEKGNPRKGYAEAAHFLLWLTDKYGEEKLTEVNELIHDNSLQITDNFILDEVVFIKAFGRAYDELLREYNKVRVDLNP